MVCQGCYHRGPVPPSLPDRERHRSRSHRLARAARRSRTWLTHHRPLRTLNHTEFLIWCWNIHHLVLRALRVQDVCGLQEPGHLPYVDPIRCPFHGDHVHRENLRRDWLGLEHCKIWRLICTHRHAIPVLLLDQLGICVLLLKLKGSFLRAQCDDNRHCLSCRSCLALLLLL